VTAPVPSWRRRPAACSRRPASSSLGRAARRRVDVYEAEGKPFPDRTLDSIKRTGVGIKGPTTTPVGSGFRSVNVLLRKELDLYACIRPCKAYEGVRTRYPETTS
jgi:isocitrate dehydrogenase